MAPLRAQHLEISRAFGMSESAAKIQEFVNANQHWQELRKQATATNHFAKSLTSAHQSLLESIKPIQQSLLHFSQLHASIKMVRDTSIRLGAAERLMAGIDLEAIKNRFQINMPIILGLEYSITQVITSYGNLSESLREISDITRLPNFVLPGATREIYATSLALNTLHSCEQRDEEEAETKNQFVAVAELETSDCIVLLQQIAPELARPYIGAREALHGDNADRTRHILSSLRELWNHLLRRLAPDDLVAAWITGITNHANLLHKGKPTRQARVLYVCRELNNEPLTDFLLHDTRALVKLIELFNRVHELEMDLTYEQLRAILLKTDSWLMYILQIFFKVD